MSLILETYHINEPKTEKRLFKVALPGWAGKIEIKDNCSPPHSSSLYSHFSEQNLKSVQTCGYNKTFSAASKNKGLNLQITNTTNTISRFPFVQMTHDSNNKYFL